MQSFEEEEEVQEIINPCGICGKELPISDIETKPIVRCSFCGGYNNNFEIIESEPEKFAPIPDIKVRWDRFSERICFSTKPMTILTIGIKGAGKSCLLEVLSLRYPKVIDLYGASDFESLGWCRPEFAKVWRSIHGTEPRILLVRGEGKDISSKFDTCTTSELTLKIIEDHDVITTVEQFFASEEDYFECMARIIHICWKERNFWEPNNIFFILVREASNWLYSRSKTISDDKFAKSEFLKAMRESRHHGISLAADFLRHVNCDKEIRDLTDLLFIKTLGAAGLDDSLHFLYRYWKPYSLMQLVPRGFGLLTARGSIGHGCSDYPIWHKTEHENILAICNIEIKNCTDEVPKERKHTLGAFEHCQIIKSYMETKNMNETAKKTERSFKTVYNHIQEHNNDVRSLHECQKCFNANVPFSKINILVAKAGRPKKEKAYQELNKQ